MARFLLLLLFCVCGWADCRLPATPALAESTPAVSTPEALLESGQFQRAKALVAPGARDARSLWLLSRAEAGLGHLEQALLLSEQSVALEPGRYEYHVQLAASNGRLAEKSSLFKQLGYAKRAKKELDTALELNPESIDALYGLMLFYYAAPAFVGGDKQKALDAAEKMTALNPARGYLAQAKLAKDRKDPVAEEAFLQKAVAANPHFYEAKTSLAKFDLARERPAVNAAEQLACEALLLNPERGEAWQVLAGVEVRNQCWDEMFALLDRAKAFVPDDGAYLYAAGEALTRTGHALPLGRAISPRVSHRSHGRGNVCGRGASASERGPATAESAG